MRFAIFALACLMTACSTTAPVVHPSDVEVQRWGSDYRAFSQSAQANEARAQQFCAEQRKKLQVSSVDESRLRFITRVQTESQLRPDLVSVGRSGYVTMFSCVS